METVIQIIWWIGLIVALLLTLVILKEAAVLLGTLRDILILAERTRQAANGIQGDFKHAGNIQDLHKPLQEINAQTGRLAAASAGVLSTFISNFGSSGRKAD